MHLDVRLEDLAGARIGDVRSERVLGRRGQPADDRVPCVLGAPVRILFLRWRILRDDRVPETGLLEGRLPALDAALDERHEHGGRRRIDVEDDRLHRLGQRRAGILLFEPPARDVAPALGAVLLAAVVHLLHVEVPDALVEHARHHRVVRQLHHAEVHDDAGASWTGGIQRGLRRRHRPLDFDAGGVGVRRLDLDVVRERHRALDERALGVEGARAHAGAAAELRHLGREHARDVDHRRVALAERLDVERHQDRFVVGGLDRLRDRLTAIGDDVVGHAAQQHAVAAPLPLHHAAPDRLASLPGADRRPGDLGDPEELFGQLVGRDLVVETLADAMDGEETLVRLGLLGDDPVVRPDHRRRGWPARTAARRGRRRRRCLFRLGRRGRLLR